MHLFVSCTPPKIGNMEELATDLRFFGRTESLLGRNGVLFYAPRMIGWSFVRVHATVRLALVEDQVLEVVNEGGQPDLGDGTRGARWCARTVPCAASSV